MRELSGPTTITATIILTCAPDLLCQGQDYRREGLGGQAAEADPRWYDMDTDLALSFYETPSNTTAGKILKDEDTVGDYKIEEKGFVVCVVNKVRADSGAQ